MRVIGIGHAAIAVPAGWASDQLRCGTPQADVAYLDPGAVRLCLAARPRGVESVLLLQGLPASKDFHADDTFSIGGVQAERQRTRCARHPTSANLCVGIVVIPSHNVTFRVESSTSAAEVDRLLQRIMIMPDRVAVPGFLTIDAAGNRPTAEQHADTFRGLGLKPEIRWTPQPVGSKDPPSGSILGVSPAPGTMLTSGATVTITAVGP